jgi:hypothetical protein
MLGRHSKSRSIGLTKYSSIEGLKRVEYTRLWEREKMISKTQKRLYRSRWYYQRKGPNWIQLDNSQLKELIG